MDVADCNLKFWLAYFVEAGVAATAAADYAVSFSENRIRCDMLSDLSRQHLNELGVTALGDVILLLKHAARRKEQIVSSVPPSTPSPAPAAAAAAAGAGAGSSSDGDSCCSPMLSAAVGREAARVSSCRKQQQQLQQLVVVSERAEASGGGAGRQREEASRSRLCTASVGEHRRVRVSPTAAAATAGAKPFASGKQLPVDTAAVAAAAAAAAATLDNHGSSKVGCTSVPMPVDRKVTERNVNDTRVTSTTAHSTFRTLNTNNNSGNNNNNNSNSSNNNNSSNSSNNINDDDTADRALRRCVTVASCDENMDSDNNAIYAERQVTWHNNADSDCSTRFSVTGLGWEKPSERRRLVTDETVTSGSQFLSNLLRRAIPPRRTDQLTYRGVLRQQRRRLSAPGTLASDRVGARDEGVTRTSVKQRLSQRHITTTSSSSSSSLDCSRASSAVVTSTQSPALAAADRQEVRSRLGRRQTARAAGSVFTRLGR